MGQYKVCQSTHNWGYRRRRKKKGTDYVFDEIMAENYSNLEKETYIQKQEAQRVPNEINPNRYTLRYNKNGKS